MIEFFKKFISTGAGVTAIAVLSFLAGQIFPSYFDYAADQRTSIEALIDQVEIRGAALEQAIEPVMKAAITRDSGDSAVGNLNEKVLELFQAVEYVQREFPETAAEREIYVGSLVRLREVSSTVTGPLDAPIFIEAASEFKRARTLYESRVAMLEPNFFGSLLAALN